MFLWQDFSLLNVLLPLYSRCPALNKFSQLPSSNRGSETPALSQLLSNRGVHFNNLKGFVYPRSLVFTPRFPIWWPGVQSYLTPHSGSMLMSWLWDSYLEKIKYVHWGRIPSMWQSLQLTETQSHKICEFLNAYFFWTILKRQDCVSLLFGVRFIIFSSITLVGHLCKLTKEKEFKTTIFQYILFRESCTWKHGEAMEVAPVPGETSWNQENQMEDVPVFKLWQH